MSPEMITAVVALATLVLSTIGSVFTLGLWLASKFRKVEIASDKRHLQNLDRFRRIGLALVSMGYKNGNNLEPGPHD